MMPKVLIINVTANWGSTGKIAESIGKSAITNGWDSYYAYGRMMNPSRNRLIKIGAQKDVYLHYINYRIFDGEGLGSKGATVCLVKTIQSLNPDIINLHNIHDHFLNYQILFQYLNQTNIKVVWTFHDCWAFTGHCYHFVPVSCERWKTGCHNCLMQIGDERTLFDRSARNWSLKKELFSANKNLTIVPVSSWLGDFVKESFLGTKKINVIRNGIDLTAFKPLEKSSENNKYKVLAVSNNWHAEKGLYDIYKLREFLSEDYEITIVGVSEKQLKELPDGISGVTRTQNVQELVKIYSNSDVLINPTYADTFPTVNLEALACGIPVITYRTGGSPEAIDQKTGIVVEQGNVHALANAIISLRSQPLSSEDCRSRAENYFDKDKCFVRYIELFNQLIK